MVDTVISATTKWYPILFDTAHNAVRSAFIWIAIAMAIGYLTAFFLLKEKTIWRPVKKYSFLVAILYAAVVLTTLLVFAFQEEGMVTILFVPILILIILIAGAAVALLLSHGRVTNIISGSLVAAGLLAVLICIGVHFANGDAIEINEVDPTAVNSQFLYLFAAFGVVLVFFIAFFFGKKDTGTFTTKSIAYAAICLALSFALSFLTLVKLPQGGSVTLVSLLPLMLYSQMFGIRRGVIVGFIYGLLQAIQTPYILHPGQFLLDYPIAFAMIGFASIFTQGGIKGKKGILLFAAGSIFAVTMRYLSHFVSGVFAFSSYAGYAGYDSSVLYSLAYNSFTFVDMAIALVVGVLMLFNSAFLKLVNGITYASLPAGTTPNVPAQTSEIPDRENAEVLSEKQHESEEQ